jgi:hypothetical protein
MAWIARTAAIVALGLYVAGVAVAGPIVVDGSDADWNAPISWYDDPDGDVSSSEYDIDLIFGDYDAGADRLAFMTRTVNPVPHQPTADFIEFVFNTDDDITTGDPNWHGCQGADYRFTWDIDGAPNNVFDYTTSNQPLFYAHNGSSWSLDFGLGAGDFQIAWGTPTPDYSIIEATVNPTLLGSPDEFVWGTYLDNGGTSNDDYAQARFGGGDDESPEPATWVLLAATAAFGAWRRRRG